MVSREDTGDCCDYRFHLILLKNAVIALNDFPDYMRFSPK
jgi:hypothetical protein